MGKPQLARAIKRDSRAEQEMVQELPRLGREPTRYKDRKRYGMKRHNPWDPMVGGPWPAALACMPAPHG